MNSPAESMMTLRDFLVPLIAGVLAMVGAWLGARTQGKLQQKTWLLQKRSEAFSSFIDALTEAQIKVIDIYCDPDLDDRQRERKITELYLPTANKARIVRLYLPKSQRSFFSKLVREISALHESTSLEGPRYHRSEEIFNEIQAMLESNLDET